MPYVQRTAGVVSGLFAVRQPGLAEEFLAENHADVVAYRSPPPPTADQIYDEVIQQQRVLKALVLALNDGSFVPGSNSTGPQIKAIIKAKM